MLSCSFCPALFRPPEGASHAFCPACLAKIANDAVQAEAYRAAIARGDVNVMPENDADRAEVRAAIRSRLTSSPDCRRPT